MERAAVLSESTQIGPEQVRLDAPADAAPPRSAPRDQLKRRQQQLLEHLAQHGRCTNRTYCELTGTSPRTALRDLSNLMERGLIVREGKRRGAVYRLA